MKKRGYPLRFSLFLTALLVFPVSCERTSGDAAIVPPPTDPLRGGVIGYGVVNVPYTHVAGTPDPQGTSLGYLRKGAIVRIVERRSVRNQRAVYSSWVYVEGSSSGWLPEGTVDIYDNESRAMTASESMDS
jgi:hypothetical protein